MPSSSAGGGTPSATRQGSGVAAANELNRIAGEAIGHVSDPPGAFDRKTAIAALVALTARHQEDAQRRETQIDSVESRLAAIATVAATLAVVILANVDKLQSAADTIQIGLGVLMLTLVITALGRVTPRFRVRKLLRGSRERTKSQLAADEASALAFDVEKLLSDAKHLDSAIGAASPNGTATGQRSAAADGPPVDLAAQIALLAYWRARACSDHHAYNVRARFAFGAAMALAAAGLFIGYGGIVAL